MAFLVRLGLIYAGVFTAMGIQMPFLPVWLAGKGLDAATIGAALAAYALARVAALPFVTHAADRLARLHTAILMAAAATAASFTLLASVSGAPAIMAVLALCGAAGAATLPLIEAYALQGLAARQRAYGPVRLWGSAAYIAGSIGAGLISTLVAPVNLIWPLVGLYWAAAATAFGLRAASDAPARPRELPRWSGLLRIPGLVAMIVAASLIQASHSLYYGFSTLQWTAAGLGGLGIGGLWALGVAAEIVLFAASPRLPARVTPAVLMMLGGAGAVVRWAAMALDPPWLLLPVLQALHALSFGATHLGAVQFLMRAAPAGRAASAQGLLATVMGIVSATAMALSGALHAACGTRGYLAMAWLASIGLAVLLIASRRRGGMPAPRQPQSTGSGG